LVALELVVGVGEGDVEVDNQRVHEEDIVLLYDSFVSGPG
jgi:hypothetical protein